MNVSRLRHHRRDYVLVAAAFVVIVYRIVQQYGIDGLTVATLMAGVILVIMGIAKFGAMNAFAALCAKRVVSSSSE